MFLIDEQSVLLESEHYNDMYSAVIWLLLMCVLKIYNIIICEKLTIGI